MAEWNPNKQFELAQIKVKDNFRLKLFCHLLCENVQILVQHFASVPNLNKSAFAYSFVTKYIIENSVGCYGAAQSKTQALFVNI